MRTTTVAPERAEHRWPALVGIAAAVTLYALLPSDAAVLPQWIVPAIAILMAVPLVAFNPHHLTRESTVSRWASIALALVIAAANQVEVVAIIERLVAGDADGPLVLLSAAQVWLTDVLVFGLIFWELDGGGPVARRSEQAGDGRRDFRFPQEDDAESDWHPGYFDYAYFGLSNMMAFSPTDVMPLTLRAKGLMAIQAVTGFALLALVISRAVNILS